MDYSWYSKVDVVEPSRNSDHCVVRLLLTLASHEARDPVRSDFDNCNSAAITEALL